MLLSKIKKKNATLLHIFESYLGASLISASFPKSSPSFNVATVPFPCITTSTDPLRIIYHERPSSPWLNTANM